MKTGFIIIGLFVLLVGSSVKANAREPPFDALVKEQEEELAADTTCAKGSRWMNDCNWCFCEDGSVTCTLKVCRSANPREPPFDALVKEQEEELAADTTCAKGSRWLNDCNWCFCEDGSVTCTLKVCQSESAEQPSNQHWQHQEPKVWKIDLEEVSCSPGSAWHDGCRDCSCEAMTAVCVHSVCPAALDPSRFYCRDGSFWKWDNDCNWCVCVSGKALCTNTTCGEEEEAGDDPRQEAEDWNRSRQEVAAIFKERVEALGIEYGSTLDQMWRTSRETNQKIGNDVADVKKNCKPGTKEDRWREGCNWCSCSDVGVKGCSQRSCSAADLERLELTSECEGRAVWLRNGEWCICINGSAGCKKFDYDPPARDEL